MMRKTTTVLFFLFSLIQLNILQAQDKEWTLLVYVVGSDIVGDAITDIGEMQAAGNTDNINIVTMLGGADLDGWRTPSASTFVNGIEVAQDFEPSQPSMTTSSTLTEFIDWGVENYPAEKYMLVFYNHGMAIRGWGWDNTADAQNSVSDIQNGIAASTFITDGNKFELIGFDACLMASFEVMSALRGFGNYYIASEETEPYHAWYWTPVITAMNTQTGLTGGTLGTLIVDNYFVQHEIEDTHNVTLSVVDLTKITDLEESLEGLVNALDDDIFLNSLIRARAESEEYSKSISDPAVSEDMVDIGDLVKHLREYEPNLETTIASVLSDLDDAVVYDRSDNTRPQATGISLFLPLNTLTSSGEVDYRINEVLVDIDYSTTIRDFIVDEYLPFAQSDNDPIAGEINVDFGGLLSPGDAYYKDLLSETYSAIRIPRRHVASLDHIQVILMEEIITQPEEYLVLGSTYPDTTVLEQDGSKIYAYEWDEQWLGLNGFPAYISDIQQIDVQDEEGQVTYVFTRIHIPALLNPGSNEEKQISLSFTFDEDFNHELEGVLREPYGTINVPSKERIKLQPGDQVQLVYEVFDSETNEAFFLEDDNAIITIENGNEDLDLEHVPLAPGSYHLGFVLMDHAQNDTIIYDPTIHEVVMVNTTETIDDGLTINLSPNPTNDLLQVQFTKPTTASLVLLNAQGQALMQKEILQSTQLAWDMSTLPKATYWLRINTENGVFTKEFIKQ